MCLDPQRGQSATSKDIGVGDSISSYGLRQLSYKSCPLETVFAKIADFLLTSTDSTSFFVIFLAGGISGSLRRFPRGQWPFFISMLAQESPPIDHAATGERPISTRTACGTDKSIANRPRARAFTATVGLAFAVYGMSLVISLNLISRSGG